MSRVADELGTGASFGRARPVSARRAATAAATGAPTDGVPDPTELPVTAISHNPDNPRDHLRNLDDMTQSVKELGVINAITVANVDAYLSERPGRADEIDEGARYLVVDGHRRLEAARRAGLDTIKVTVDDARVATDQSLLEAAFVANYHRDGMTELEEAHALESLVKFYGSQSKASQRLGMAQSTISSKLSFLKLSDELQADLATGQRKAEHVRNLGKLSPQEQRDQADARAGEARRAAVQEKETGRAPATPPAPAAQSEPPIAMKPDAPSAAVPQGAPAGSRGRDDASDYHGVIIPEAVAADAAPGAPVPEQRPEPVPKPALIKMPWADGAAAMDIVFDRLTAHGQRHTALARYIELHGGPKAFVAEVASVNPEMVTELLEALEQH